jgi:hypothetical protein
MDISVQPPILPMREIPVIIATVSSGAT